MKSQTNFGTVKELISEKWFKSDHQTDHCHSKHGRNRKCASSNCYSWSVSTYI